MFDQTFVDTGGPTRKPWTVAASFAAQSALISVALIIPILHPGLLQPKIDTPVWIHLQPVQKIVQVETGHATATRRSVIPKAFVAPTTKVPNGKPFRLVDANLGSSFPGDIIVAGPGPASTGTGNDIFSNLLPTAKPPEPVKTAKPSPPATPANPIAVSAGVQAAKLIFGPKPAYPPLARTARIQGTVKIQAVIGADGAINSLQVMSGPPLLIPAAKDAVSRWRYQATMLNGRAVDVITEIEVIFTLGGN
jgi:protein TonB